MKKKLLVLMSALLMLALAACGGSDDASSDSGKGSDGGSVTLEAKNWEFDKEEYTVPAGDVTINLKNAEGFHSVTIDDTDVKIEGDGKATANLEAGEYTIRCATPCGEGHTDMTAKLVVE
ncbi:cytochrome C oxidase subunit II [Pseudalkalibacillus caeni]|uniref:Cytochrome C oxidase subunit II n=1 Tax=Exobacillus caeni TaxID=2574798 RepID=A0A5R9F9P2_9BACL|nr:cytochrome C oxidase subunit II [Pseudalkalibacillus caeni]TLS38986.1 cytochrome C oxidase subunit II [Pseudalkalibacillus caeni]